MIKREREVNSVRESGTETQKKTGRDQDKRGWR